MPKYKIKRKHGKIYVQVRYLLLFWRYVEDDDYSPLEFKRLEEAKKFIGTKPHQVPRQYPDSAKTKRKSSSAHHQYTKT